MITSTVIGGLPAQHPESAANLMRVTVDHVLASGGVTYPSTDLWVGDRVDAKGQLMPEPLFGEPIAWDGHHVVFRGVTYHKPEYDVPSNEALH